MAPQPVGFLARVSCNQCSKTALTESGDNFGAVVSCGCCPEDHDHDAAANACPGAGFNHQEAACPHPEGACGYWTSVQAASVGQVADDANHVVVHAGGHAGNVQVLNLATDEVPEGAVPVGGIGCPGGHCALGVDGCTVCRPVTITVLRLGEAG